MIDVLLEPLVQMAITIASLGITVVVLVASQCRHRASMRALREREAALTREAANTQAMLAQIKEERDKALAAQRAKSFFFSTVSHDIRTPLNAIVGFSERLKLGIEDPVERKIALDSILVSSKTLLQLINDVLDLSKLEAGKMEIMPEPTNVVELFSGLLAAFKVTLKKDVQLITDVKPMPLLKIDPQRIRQILFNLVGNAVKFTEHGSITVTAAWENGTFRFSVKDTGCGISDEDLRHIADPYVQVGKGRRATGGTGLGLAICQQLVAHMQGGIEVASCLGKGTVFEVTIPGVQCDESAARRQLSMTQQIRLAMTQKEIRYRRILVVDDSPINLRVIQSMLKSYGITDVTTAANGRAALAILTSSPQPFDLVLTDMWMPEMDGEGLVRAIRGDAKLAMLPVYVLTADVELPRSVAAAGFTGVMLKPLTLAKIGEILG